ncbi:MAG TPA: hypothetical protein IAB38_06485 [Candidatus Onthousia excrementipullorum]|uniref:Uncharacterized protein n=1 Tax=Candidatus Onthousia excrementipullorum TaxID=2840884 RepID=A0A9D1DVC0_9FIRM|nr:hypothetical protein [Candidatus Onthousia excrementipullorum]
MYNDKEEYLKRVIKRTYKRYIGERTDGKATIVDVLKFFNISIDTTRLEDYDIESIDYNIPSIKVVDKKDNTTVTSKYTEDAKLLNYSGNTKFINVIITNPNYRIESLYYTNSTIPIISQLTFIKDDYELTFEKERENYFGFGISADTRFVIRYKKNIKEGRKKGKQSLLTKIYQIKDSNTFEQDYTYDLQHLINYNDRQDKYCYNEFGTIIYGINNIEIKDKLHQFNGVCFEKINKEFRSYLPYNINKKDFTKYFNKNVCKSAIMFTGSTDEGIHHFLTISKNKTFNNDDALTTDDNIHLKYEAIKWKSITKEDGIPDQEKVIIAKKELQVAKINDDNISSLEIQSILEQLTAKENEDIDNIFIQTVINELMNFINKLEIQKGFKEEPIDELSPKEFINKTFEEIYTLVSNDKDKFFDLISNQFHNATNIKLEQGHTKILK